MKLSEEAFLDLKEELARQLEAGQIDRAGAIKQLTNAGWSVALSVEFCRNVVDGEGE